MTDTPEPMFLLLKRGYYWRPNAQGYTSSISEAGRYTEAEARAYCRNPDVTMIPAPTSADNARVAQEPVGWQYRYKYDDFEWSDWANDRRPDADDLLKSNVLIAEEARPIFTQDQLDAAVRAERERCAIIAENFTVRSHALERDVPMWHRAKVAAAIREGE